MQNTKEEGPKLETNSPQPPELESNTAVILSLTELDAFPGTNIYNRHAKIARFEAFTNLVSPPSSDSGSVRRIIAYQKPSFPYAAPTDADYGHSMVGRGHISTFLIKLSRRGLQGRIFSCAGRIGKLLFVSRRSCLTVVVKTGLASLGGLGLRKVNGYDIKDEMDGIHESLG